MSSLFPLHFETGKHPKNSPFLSDEEYSKCLDTLTKACTDLFVVNAITKQILLGKRKVQPQPDWWYGAGGRMKPGETPFDSAARILKRELGMVLPEDAKKHVKQGGRFTGVGAYSYTWEFREQQPKNNGCADISCVMAIEVTSSEISSFKFDSAEYELHAWLDSQTIIEDATKHPALRRSVADYVRGREWESLVSGSQDGEADASLGKKLKEFVAKWTETDEVLMQAYDSFVDTSSSSEKKQKMST